MALLKMCRCGKIIPQALDMCPECAQHAADRHKEYNATRRERERIRSIQAPNGAEQERSACNTPEDLTCMHYM